MSNIVDDFRHLTTREFYALGVQQVAYVKKAAEDGAVGYAIHAADGSRIGFVATRELAFAALKQNDLEPLSVH